MLRGQQAHYKCVLDFSEDGSLSLGVFLFYFKKTSVALLEFFQVEDFADLGTPVPKKSYHHLGLSPMRPNKIWTCHTTKPLEHKRLLVNVVVVGPFEEKEKGTSVASDVVKVEGEDPATPGPLKRNHPGTVTIPQYRFNKTKQHTRSSTKLLCSKFPKSSI